MTNDNRRRHFFINKPLQLRYMVYLTLPLLTITAVIMLALYIGIWGSMLDAFNDERLRTDLLTASRLTEYEQARQPVDGEKNKTLLFFKQAEKLSQRQREVFKEILDNSNEKIIPKFILLMVFIAWGSVYISHKVAGPIYRFDKTLDEVKKGNLRVRIHLRKEDEGQSLAKTFNETLSGLDQTFSKIKNIIRENEADAPKMTSRLKEELSKIKTSADI